MIKSRKFIAALALFVAATAFVFTNHTDFTGWADMMKWIFGIYVGGNVGAHTAAKVKIGNGHHAPAAPQPTTPGVIIAQDDVHVGHSATTPSPFVAVKTMSGKDPAEVAEQIQQQDPEGLELPPLEKGEKL
tara:strand:+ start:92 stop:484 length:393 start_codon:yes stop_codon:yes gene_type:complete